MGYVMISFSDLEEKIEFIFWHILSNQTIINFRYQNSNVYVPTSILCNETNTYK